MEKPNVNNLNGVSNFGHGFPEETKAEEPLAALPDNSMDDEKETEGVQADVPTDETEEEKDNG